MVPHGKTDLDHHSTSRVKEEEEEETETLVCRTSLVAFDVYVYAALILVSIESETSQIL